MHPSAWKPAVLLSTCLLFVAVCVPAADARIWTDATGKYTVDAELIDFDAKTAVMRRASSGNLIAVPIEKLSKQDREYLQTKADTQSIKEGADGNRTWTLRDGNEFRGRVLRYGRGTMTIQRVRGRVCISWKPQRPTGQTEIVEKPIRDTSKLHQYMIPKVVTQYEPDVTVNSVRELEAWFGRLRGESREYPLEGVVLHLESDEEFAVPFFLFTEKDLEVLKPGWDEWVAAEKEHAKEEEAKRAEQERAELYMRARVRAQQQDQKQNMAINYFVFGVAQWQVQLIPKPGTNLPPTTAIVPGRNSHDARVAALQSYPQYVVGAIRRLTPY
jgi:hypothetical protein